MRVRQYRVKDWRGTLAGHPCFILGNAPSILQHDLTLLDPFLTIGVNRIHQIFDPTILLWQDESLELDFDHIKAIKFCRDTIDAPSPSGIHRYYHFHLVLYRLKFDHYKTHVLHGTGNTGCLAAQLAIGMGCDPIILLGMDCKTAEGKDDFHGRNENWSDRTLEFCRNAMQLLKDECPVEIISCSNSELWPQNSLGAVVPRFEEFKRSREFYNKFLIG